MKVSVIMPALNAAPYIERAIRSAMTQTLRELEIIVVNDGSSDETSSIVRKLMDEDDRIVLIEHETRLGTSVARNDAIAVARGDWIAVLDADDEFLPERLELMVLQAEARKLDMLSDQLALVDFDTNKVMGFAFRQSWLENPDILSAEDYLKKDWPGLSGTYHFGYMKPIVRTAFIRNTGILYRPGVHLAQDTLFWASLLMGGARLGVTRHALYLYYLRPFSASRKKRPTTQMIEVNDFMAECLTDLAARGKLGPDVDFQRFRRLFQKRSKALWMQYALLSLKARAYSNLPKAVMNISPFILLKAVRVFTGARLRRATVKIGLEGFLPPPDPDRILI